MHLNAFLWQNFLESKKGQEWLDFFSHLRRHYEKESEKLKEFIDKWALQGSLDYASTAEEEIDAVLNALDILEDVTKQGLLPTHIESWDDADAYYRDGVASLVIEWPGGEVEPEFYMDDVPRLSVALNCLYPKFFFPYYFYPQFYVLKKIFDEFGIFLPPVPPKRDGNARFYYYLELCRSLRDFWLNLGFEPEHIPVFLYGFAPEVVDLKYPPIANLPKPHRAWFVGGGKSDNGDFEYLDRITQSSQAFWQGNVETEVGDIVVMYCLTPRSYIHSIWRAVRPGAHEPFFYFYSTIWIGYPQLVKPISLAEIKSDPILSELPLVKQNMQGINGRRIEKRFYDRILTLLEARGQDITSLPRLEDVDMGEIKLQNERDVEVNLLEPLLRELGFMSEDWERQIKLQVGRSEKVIPDYVIWPSRTASSRNIQGAWVWEAKFTITTNAQLQKDFEQAASYARLVSAKGVGLISIEGIWLSLQVDDYSFHKAKHFSRQRLNEIDGLNEIRDIASKRRITTNR